MKIGVCVSSLVAPWIDLSDQPCGDIRVTRLELDSRKVQPGDTFVAIQGHASDGRTYIDSAVRQGVNLVLAQADDDTPHGLILVKDGVSVIYIQELNRHLSELACRLNPVEHCQLIGVTGTNGKTTVTQLIAQWLDLLGKKASVMGTTGNGFLTDLHPAENTTGSALAIVETIARLANAGSEYTALEVSSHGLVQGRVKALPFKVGVFTNLSRDHLDYHGSMDAYADAKRMLFTEHCCQYAVINVDDPVGKQWIDQIGGAVAVSLIGPVTSAYKVIWATSVSYAESGIAIQFDGSWGTGKVHAPLIGAFNAYNLLVSFATLLLLGFDITELASVSDQLKPVVGRMELFKNDSQAKVVVDYAHTPDALEKALTALKIHCDGELWVIVGCGGDRDTGKRPMMSAIAEQFADHVVFTDDNPRTESPQQIIEDMLAGLSCPELVMIEHSRYHAVQRVLSMAKANDIILLAGKGHEDYQVIGTTKHHYSDRETAMTLLGLTHD